MRGSKVEKLPRYQTTDELKVLAHIYGDEDALQRLKFRERALKIVDNAMQKLAYHRAMKVVKND